MITQPLSEEELRLLEDSEPEDMPQDTPLPVEEPAPDPQEVARRQGYSWGDIFDHIGKASLNALGFGYKQPDIDKHLGYTDPSEMENNAKASWTSSLVADPKLLESLSGPEPAFDLMGNTSFASGYGQALLDRTVKGPSDFAYRYAGAAMEAAYDVLGFNNDEGSATQIAAAFAADQMLSMLPTPEDLTDATIALTPDGTNADTVRENLVDRWLTTGQDFATSAMKALGDPELYNTLVASRPLSLLDEAGKGVMRGISSTIIDTSHIGLALGKIAADPIGKLLGVDVDAAAISLAADLDAQQKIWEERFKGTDFSKAGESPDKFIAGVLGQSVPMIAEYVAAGVPAMIAYGIMHGAEAAYRETGSWGAAAAGAVIGGAAAGAPAPFLHGVAGRSLIESAVRGAAGMGIVGGITSIANEVPRAIASGEWTKAAWQGVENVPQGVVEGAIGGVLFGGLQRAMRPPPAKLLDMSKPPGETMTDVSATEALAPIRPAELAPVLPGEGEAPPSPRQRPTYEFKPAAEGTFSDEGLPAYTGSRLDIHRNGEHVASAEIMKTGTDAHIDSITSDLAGKTVAEGTPNIFGPREMRQMARAYFEANPEIQTISGLRVTGARGSDGKIAGADANADVTVTREQIMGKAFAPDATPASKIESLALEPGDMTSGKHFEDTLVAMGDTDPKALALARGHDTAWGLMRYARSLMGELLRDTRGGGDMERLLTEGERQELARQEERMQRAREPRDAGAGGAPGLRSTRAAPYPNEPQAPTGLDLIQRDMERGAMRRSREPRDAGAGGIPGETSTRAAPYPAPPLPMPSGPGRFWQSLVRDQLRKDNALGEQDLINLGRRVDALRHVYNPHMKEYEDAQGMDKLKTVIGQAIHMAEGRSEVTIKNPDGSSSIIVMDPNNETTPVFQAFRAMSDEVWSMASQRVAEGKLDAVGYVKDWWVHKWTDPSAALKAWQGSGGQQGSAGSLTHQRILPTDADGLALGLTPKVLDPGDRLMSSFAGTIRFLRHLDTMDHLETVGALVRHIPKNDSLPFPDATPIIGRSSERQTPDGIERAYMPKAAANLYNNALTQGWHSGPVTADWYKQLMWAKNASTSLQLMVPLFHSFVIAGSTLTTGVQMAMTEMYHGNLGQAALEIGKTFTGVKAKEIAEAGYKTMQDYANKTGNPDVQALVEVGGRFGKRQLPYQMGSHANVVTSIMQNKGHVFEAAGREMVREIKELGGVEGESMMKTAAMLLPRVSDMTLGRIATNTSAPLFDYAIPIAKAGSTMLRAQQYLRLNLDATPEQKSTRLRQMIDNAEDRMGEMNLDNVFWNKWFKHTANVASVSTSWAYGSWRWFAAASGYNLERGVEWNPEATGSLVAAVAVYAGMNGLLTYMNTGEAPKDVWDLVNFRTGGVTKTGAVQRGLIPTEFKELFDMGRIVAEAMYDPNPMMSVPHGLMHYVMAKENPFFRAITATFTGEDAIGHKIADTPGGWTGFFKNQVTPLVLTNWNANPPGSGLTPAERLIIREAPNWVTDPKKYAEGRIWLHGQWAKEELARAGREAIEQGHEPPEGYNPKSRQIWIGDPKEPKPKNTSERGASDAGRARLMQPLSEGFPTATRSSGGATPQRAKRRVMTPGQAVRSGTYRRGVG